MGITEYFGKKLRAWGASICKVAQAAPANLDDVILCEPPIFTLFKIARET